MANLKQTVITSFAKSYIASEHSCLDPDVEPEDPEICLEQKEIEQYKNGDYLNSGNQSSSDESGEGSASENTRHGH